MKKIVVLILILLSALTVWYLFIKKYDYQVSFKVNMTPASMYYEVAGITSWDAKEGRKNVTLIDTTLFKHVQQKVQKQDGFLILDWHFKKLADTLTKVTVGATLSKQSIKNRLQLLINSSDFVSSYKNQMMAYNISLYDFTKTFRVQIEGESTIPEIQYASSFLKAKRSEKAGKMITANMDLFLSIPKNSLLEKGNPLIKVRYWDFISDSIHFDFGFPVKYKDSLHKGYGKQLPQKALKATYFGNYRNSDQAWFMLLSYAKDKGIAVEKKPIEIFYNNPMQGGDELQWKAEVFLPIK